MDWIWATITLLLLLQLRPLRRALLSRWLMAVFRRVLPSMSDTEKAALMAGNVSWEGELFSGRPNWKKLFQKPMSQLSTEEQAFLDGPVEELCGMLSDWQIVHQHKGIPEAILAFIKQQRFFGMIIPKSYGGLEFSAYAHAQVIAKIASVSTSVATVVSVPNSLGPAELLMHYGTEAEKNFYLPRLAQGEEIPCFALTSAHAGSDAAGSMQDYGVVCEAEFEGKKQLCIRVNWSKRYITLAPIATLLGVAFKLYDPDHLLGDKTEIGITCALVPVQTPGVVTGRRHLPLGSAFPNGPTQGKDVIIPLDWVIGGKKQLGNGWTMLMQCLAAGRGISLPSMAAGNMKKALFASGVYAQVRQQFGVPIGAFDGIQAALAQVAGHGFMMEALRLFVLSDLDEGNQAPVATAIAKSYVTEWARAVILGAMDIHGGKGICMGPKNYLAQGYIESPISITVEGANILTRSLIIFGQGLIRCHPHLYQEMESCQQTTKAGLKAFDKALFAHIGYVLRNAWRSFFGGLTGSKAIWVPAGKYRRYLQQISRYSAVLGLLSDVSMLFLGGKIKRMERLSERMGAIVGHLYAASAVLHFAHAHADIDSQAFVDWAMIRLMAETKRNISEFLYNFPNKTVGLLLRAWVFPWGVHLKMPTDGDDKKIAVAIQQQSAIRDLIIQGLYRSNSVNNPIANFDAVLEQVKALSEQDEAVRDMAKDDPTVGYDYGAWVQEAVKRKIITEQEAEQLLCMDKERMNIIHVDDFSDQEFRSNSVRG